MGSNKRFAFDYFFYIIWKQPGKFIGGWAEKAIRITIWCFLNWYQLVEPFLDWPFWLSWTNNKQLSWRAVERNWAGHIYEKNRCHPSSETWSNCPLLPCWSISQRLLTFWLYLDLEWMIVAHLAMECTERNPSFFKSLTAKYGIFNE